MGVGLEWDWDWGRGSEFLYYFGVGLLSSFFLSFFNFASLLWDSILNDNILYSYFIARGLNCRYLHFCTSIVFFCMYVPGYCFCVIRITWSIILLKVDIFCHYDFLSTWTFYEFWMKVACAWWSLAQWLGLTTIYHCSEQLQLNINISRETESDKQKKSQYGTGGRYYLPTKV